MPGLDVHAVASGRLPLLVGPVLSQDGGVRNGGLGHCAVAGVGSFFARINYVCLAFGTGPSEQMLVVFWVATHRVNLEQLLAYGLVFERPPELIGAHAWLAAEVYVGVNNLMAELNGD